MALPHAVVEIGGTALLIAGVFILTFLFVCLAAYWLLKGSSGSRGATSGLAIRRAARILTSGPYGPVVWIKSGTRCSAFTASS